jgi:hypothetical protein
MDTRLGTTSCSMQQEASSAVGCAMQLPHCNPCVWGSISRLKRLQNLVIAIGRRYQKRPFICISYARMSTPSRLARQRKNRRPFPRTLGSSKSIKLLEFGIQAGRARRDHVRFDNRQRELIGSCLFEKRKRGSLDFREIESVRPAVQAVRQHLERRHPTYIHVSLMDARSFR